MIFDKNSFLSGIAVGRQLKGWATGGDSGAPRPTETLTVLSGIIKHELKSLGTYLVTTADFLESTESVVAAMVKIGIMDAGTYLLSLTEELDGTPSVSGVSVSVTGVTWLSAAVSLPGQELNESVSVSAVMEVDR